MNALFSLSVRIFNDILPKSIDAHFLYSQTADNEKSIIEAALKTQKNNNIKNDWLIMKTLPMSGYRGFNTVKDMLIQAGIKGSKITGVPTENTMLHTLIESLAVVGYCKEKGYQSLIVSATPFHQVRAFMTAVTAAERIYPKLKIYSLTGAAYSWNEKVVHSQGKTSGTRADLINSEAERISVYGDKGDLIRVEQVLDYLDKRD